MLCLGIVAVLSALDSYFVSHAYFTTLLRGASVQIVFGFEVSAAKACVRFLTRLQCTVRVERCVS